MSLEERVSRAQSTITAQREALAAIVAQAQLDCGFGSAFECLKRWKERAVRLLGEQVHHSEATRLAQKRKGSFIMGDPMRNLVDEVKMFDAFLLALSEEIQSHPEDILDAPFAAPSEAPTMTIAQPGTSNAVFIIHGRDELGKMLSMTLLSLALLAGCSEQLLKPNLPQTMNTSAAPVMYQVDEFNNDRAAYKAAFESDLPRARRLRDVMISRIRADIEANYREYETVLFTGQASFNIWSDTLELGLALATTISKGERAKTVLGAVLTAVKGERLSIDKNFFREKTSELIISKMQANRDKVKNRILDKMSKLPADKYTFEEAMVDLIEYFHAGTLQGAIVSLANEAGKDAVEAKERTEDIELFRTATSEEVVSVAAIRSGIRKLFASWNAVQTDATKSKPILDQAKKALNELGVSFKDTDSGQAIFRSLNEQITKVTTAIDREDYLKKLTDAFRKAQIIE